MVVGAVANVVIANVDRRGRFNVRSTATYAACFHELKYAFTAEECWFCLSNPNLAKHLIVSVGIECYVTLPKGQIIPTHGDVAALSVISSVPGGGHVLIVPIAHYPTLAALTPDVSGPVLQEIDQYVRVVA
jgi:hypothetical protein